MPTSLTDKQKKIKGYRALTETALILESLTDQLGTLDQKTKGLHEYCNGTINEVKDEMLKWMDIIIDRRNTYFKIKDYKLHNNKF
jgi:hypothetical protein